MRDSTPADVARIARMLDMLALAESASDPGRAMLAMNSTPSRALGDSDCPQDIAPVALLLGIAARRDARLDARMVDSLASGSWGGHEPVLHLAGSSAARSHRVRETGTLQTHRPHRRWFSPVGLAAGTLIASATGLALLAMSGRHGSVLGVGKGMPSIAITTPQGEQGVEDLEEILGDSSSDPHAGGRDGVVAVPAVTGFMVQSSDESTAEWAALESLFEPLDRIATSRETPSLALQIAADAAALERRVALKDGGLFDADPGSATMDSETPGATPDATPGATSGESKGTSGAVP